MNRTCVAVLGAAALAIAGCGGGEDSSSADATLTKAQYIAKADGICREVKKAHQPYSDRVDKLPSGGDIKQVAPILEGALGESRKGMTRLRALPEPAEDKASLTAYYAAAEKLLTAHAKLAEAAKTNDRPTGEKVAQTTPALSEDERRLAGDYGFKDCENVF